MLIWKKWVIYIQSEKNPSTNNCQNFKPKKSILKQKIEEETEKTDELQKYEKKFATPEFCFRRVVHRKFHKIN